MPRPSPIALSFLSSCLAGTVLACGGVSPDAAIPVTPTATPTASATSSAAVPVPTAWRDDLPVPEKIALMKATVTPRLGKVFQTRSAQHYADFGCSSCHGPDNKDPKDFLPTLTMKDGKLTCFGDSPEMSKFMAEKVVPEMASALGEAPFNPATKTGFGCPGCHTIQTK